ncbi:hypothetical protein, partial [Pseudomonas aeruginosa]|uniref:hypothetical protein n=1 Tax=Pseudomonas aeruginosa TaxID=287 RepID=UPI0021F22FE8
GVEVIHPLHALLQFAYRGGGGGGGGAAGGGGGPPGGGPPPPPPPPAETQALRALPSGTNT